jgi:tetratricopeptide (TPR) repeat protein
LVKDYINTNLDKIHVNLCKDFFRVMRKLWDNYYPLNANRDLAFEYGCILFKIKKYSKAIEFYEHSRLYNGDNANTLFNIALCYKELNIPDNSLVYAKMALKADPSYDKAKVLLSVLDNDITAEKLLDMI